MRSADRFVRRCAIALALLTALSLAAVAQGEVVQEFGFQIKGAKPDGRYTLVFSSSSFDVTGGVPDTLTEDSIRFPKGAVVRRQFINRKYYCDLKKFVDMLRANHPNAPDFNGLVNQTLRGGRVPPRSTKDLVGVCRFAHIGGGTVVIDARPYVAQAFPGHFEMFWAKPSKGALGTFAIVGSADPSSPVVAQNPTLRNTHPLLKVDLVDDPTPDGVYGYKILLPVGPIAGINISFASVQATTPGMTLTRKTSKCAKKRGGRCVKKRVTKKNLFWLTRPACPPSGQLSFQAFYAYANSPSQTKTIEMHCPKFNP
jgi:hypothetical protein